MKLNPSTAPSGRKRAHTKHRPILSAFALLVVGALAACSSMPTENPLLDQARADYRAAQVDGQTANLAPTELRQAGDALARAEAAQQRRDDSQRTDHLAYLAKQSVVLARETASRKSAEVGMVAAAADRDRMRLAARTREAAVATQAAAVATQDAAAANRDAASSRRESEAAQRVAVAAGQMAMASQQQADEAARSNMALQSQLQAQAQALRELNAKETERGMVITLGDVLFDSGQAQLQAGGISGLQRLSGFLRQYPQRRVLVEGYTDNVGSETMNSALSGRRAEAVQGALLGMGVERGQISAQGYGEAFPVAGNDSTSGRQLNRRVEIVLSDETGALKTR